jgi:Dynein heavy chain, N-terminal region 1
MCPLVSPVARRKGMCNSRQQLLEGTEIWVAAENAYNERVSRVENQIISRLRDRLGTARNANEMFRVFSKFNALFVRPKVRSTHLLYEGYWKSYNTHANRSGVPSKNTRPSSLTQLRRISSVCMTRYAYH